MTCVHSTEALDEALYQLDNLGPLAEPRALQAAAAALPRGHRDRRLAAGILDGMDLHFYRGRWGDPHYREGWNFGCLLRRRIAN